jgi:hypothetical protein
MPKFGRGYGNTLQFIINKLLLKFRHLKFNIDNRMHKKLGFAMLRATNDT